MRNSSFASPVFAFAAALSVSLALAANPRPVLAADEASAGQVDKASSTPGKPEKPSKPALDRSGKPRKGEASFYGSEFFGKTMADGTPMDPEAHIAASRTLPLGTKAKVTNLENGKSATVEIRDRGPYVDGRIIDLSPITADKLGFREQGVVRVEVAPIEIPLPDGSVKPGAIAMQEDAP